MREQNPNLRDEKINVTKGINAGRKERKIGKILLIVFSMLVILAIVVLFAMPWIITGGMVNRHVDFSTMYTPEDYGITSEKLKLTTSDDVNITAYEVYTNSPKAVVIFLSGTHNPSVTAFYGHTEMLQENGYASILCEQRAHGESEGDVISLGYKEYLDVKAVVDYIKKTDRYSHVPIVVCGLSMGGATAINAAGEIPEIDGVISMSAFSSWEDAFCDNMESMGAPKFFCTIEKPFARLYVGFKYGFGAMNINAKTEIKKLGNRPALIYHSIDDSQVPYASFERIVENAPSNIETWVKDGDYHIPTESFEDPTDDPEYSKRILDFFDSHFI